MKNVMSQRLCGVYLLIALTTLGVACGPSSPSNQTTPTARISAAPKAVRGAQVALSGSLSSDPKGAELTYGWTLTEFPLGSAAVLTSLTGVISSLTLDKGGFYTVQLVVTNTQGATGRIDTVRIEAVGSDGVNHPPVAIASTTVGSVSALLDGSLSYDVDGDALTYAWTVFPQYTGFISNPNDAIAHFFTNLAQAVTIELKVSDGIDTDTIVTLVTATGAPATTTTP